MHVALHARDFALTQALKQHIHRKLQFALTRIASHIQTVTVRVNDINGPKGGADKHCQLTVSLKAMEPVVIEETQADLYHAIDRAMQRASHTITRKVDRARTQKRVSRKISVPDSTNEDKLDSQQYINE